MRRKTLATGRIGGETRSRTSCGGGRIGWRRSERPRHGWRRRNARRTMPGDGNRARIGIRREGRRTNEVMENRHPKAQSNFTDPESGIMKTSTEGYQQCYNAQVTVDAENQLLVANEVTTNASDQGHMIQQLDTVQATTGDCRRRFWPIRTTATNGTWPNWRRGGSTGMWRWVERESPRPSGWRRNWRRRPGGRSTQRANGSRKRPTAGSKRCWDFGVSAFEDSRRCKGSGILCVWR